MNTATKTIPAFRSYGRYASSNYGAHTLAFTVGRLTYYFSYKTLVAYQGAGADWTRPVVRRNEWGPTTGKHLNWIDGGSPEAKRARLDEDTFLRRLAERDA